MNLSNLLANVTLGASKPNTDWHSRTTAISDVDYVGDISQQCMNGFWWNIFEWWSWSKPPRTNKLYFSGDPDHYRIQVPGSGSGSRPRDFWWISLMTFLEGAGGRGPKNNRLDFGSDPDQSAMVHAFQDPDHHRDPGIFKRILYLLLRFLLTVKNKTRQSSAEVCSLLSAFWYFLLIINDVQTTNTHALQSISRQ